MGRWWGVKGGGASIHMASYIWGVVGRQYIYGAS